MLPWALVQRLNGEVIEPITRIVPVEHAASPAFHFPPGGKGSRPVRGFPQIRCGGLHQRTGATRFGLESVNESTSFPRRAAVAGDDGNDSGHLDLECVDDARVNERHGSSDD